MDSRRNGVHISFKVEVDSRAKKVSGQRYGEKQMAQVDRDARTGRTWEKRDEATRS
ncbi:MAG TPA: hypothetical protein VES88_01515 [Gemmatimonadaceae bacterium]|nr:hypothetical protein [Gemmatimonadaceae bacterium]